VRRIHGDKGYRGHNYPDRFKVWISGQVRRVTKAIRREMRRRAAVEPVIGHLKDDHRMRRNHLKGRGGDRINAVLAAAGYPDDPRRGDAVSGLDAASDECKVFHAATSIADGKVVTSGGRVLCVTALGDTVRHAQRNAYAAVARIHFDGMQYRTDIGHRALAARKGKENPATRAGSVR
jgi:hypothetical protein